MPTIRFSSPTPLNDVNQFLTSAFQDPQLVDPNTARATGLLGADEVDVALTGIFFDEGDGPEGSADLVVVEEIEGGEIFRYRPDPPEPSFSFVNGVILPPDPEEVVTVLGSGGRDELDLRDFPGVAVVDGEAGSDLLLGSIRNETLFGSGGRDEIRAGGGDDDIDGGAKADRIFAGGGNDLCNAGGGADFVNAGGGADICDLGGGNDELIAGGGADSGFGGNGDDVMDMGGGADFCDGGRGRDAYDLGAGADICSELSGRTQVTLGRGRDTCRMFEDRDVIYVIEDWERALDTLECGYVDPSIPATDRGARRLLDFDLGRNRKQGIDVLLGDSQAQLKNLKRADFNRLARAEEDGQAQLEKVAVQMFDIDLINFA
ncbi:MAG: calcium-binding protein [Pseudomonadota bacterium]